MMQRSRTSPRFPASLMSNQFIGFVVQCRSNGKVFGHQVGGATVPNSSSRFTEFAAGQMISSATADEAVITEETIRALPAFASPAEAIGKTIEFLAPADDKADSNAKLRTTSPRVSLDCL